MRIFPTIITTTLWGQVMMIVGILAPRLRDAGNFSVFPGVVRAPARTSVIAPRSGGRPNEVGVYEPQMAFLKKELLRLET